MVILGLALAASAVIASSASALPVALAARSCNLTRYYESLGPTYVESLNVSSVSCATGIKLIKNYNHCRLQSGGAKGRCHMAVLGFRCTERRSTSPDQFIAMTRCTNGRKVVSFSYSENT
jgi:hypothetical protein